MMGKSINKCGLVLCIGLIIGTSGCASFSRKRLPVIDAFPPVAVDADKPSLAYQFDAEVHLFGEKDAPPNMKQIWESEMFEVLQECDYFSSIEASADGKELCLKVLMVDSGTPAVIVPAVITGLSLYTIPSWATDQFAVNASVRTLDGEEHEYQLEDAGTMVQWLPMIFATPFIPPMKVYPEIRKNIFRNLILEMQRDDLLPQPVVEEEEVIVETEL